MNRHTHFASRRSRAAAFVLAAATLGISTGCEVITNVDRDQIGNAGAGGAGGEVNSGGSGGAGQTGGMGGTTTSGTGGMPGTGGGGGIGGMMGTGGAATGGMAGTGGGATGGMGGSGGAGGCSAPADCPGTDTACRARTCASGVCGFVDLIAAGSPTPNQMVGDCKREVCDANGNPAIIADNTDVLDDGSDCTINSCSGGVAQMTLVSSGMSCMTNGGKVCDGQGTCVECNVAMDCMSGVCMSKVCVAATCMDGVKNGNETDKDCGGGSCLACDVGKACMGNADCKSNLCMGNVCAPSTCGDGTKSASEACDDGNSMNGDCCSSACAIESGCEIEPNDTDATANAWGVVAVGNQVKAFNNPMDDIDVFSIVVPMNSTGTLTAEIKDGPVGSTCSNPAEIDSHLTIRNTAGLVLATHDDLSPGFNNCSKVTLSNLPAGTYFVEAMRSTLAPAGLPTYDYRLQVDLVTVACGDGVIGAGENCDDSDTDNLDGCSAFCSVEAGWTCTGQPSMCTFTCGNGAITGNEQCDDGGVVNGDGCSSTCQFEIAPEVEQNGTCGTANGPFVPPFLFNGAINPASDQDYVAITIPAYADLKIATFVPSVNSCTMGNDTFIELRAPDCTTVLVSDDEDGINSCSLIDSTNIADAAARHLPPGTYYVRVEEYLNNSPIAGYQLQVTYDALCGNNITEGSEQCDGQPTCGSNCMPLPSCGDGLLAMGEQCDDGNMNSNDGCSALCTVEADSSCSGVPSVCTKFESNCNDGVDNDNDGMTDAADSNCTLPAYFPACSAGQTLRVYKSSDTPKPIPDGSSLGVTSTINIANNIGTIASNAVLLNVTHPWLEDIDITLVSPANASFDVTSDNGVSDDNYTNTLFKSSCPPITMGMAPYSGCFAPEASFGSLVGTPAQGVWQLRAVDDTSTDFGTLGNWALVLCIAP